MTMRHDVSSKASRKAGLGTSVSGLEETVRLLVSVYCVVSAKAMLLSLTIDPLSLLIWIPPAP